uniref:ATP synthase F0 subunit 8 n=1 Tax=Goniurosaurus bawanglingensis TaxID=2234022 RepID=UPI002A80301D|nr:ATP synthase F0 subunit 8 [Goniurosaurus bawanglingensis]WOA02151.1 ATP synthase F0 subunit 8 [Goniurosaurus bawanglingensis]
MPQLNPAPWFMTFLLTWVILLLLMKPKLLQTKYLKTPDTTKANFKNMMWTWPWFQTSLTNF